MRLTKHRKAILKKLENNKTPLSAELLMATFPERTIDLSTVYRSLDVLHNAGMISKSIINNTAYYFSNNHEHHHFMVCLTCKKMFEIDCHIHDTLDKIENDTNFKVIQHDLTFYGYCNECQVN